VPVAAQRHELLKYMCSREFDPTEFFTVVTIGKPQGECPTIMGIMGTTTITTLLLAPSEVRGHQYQFVPQSLNIPSES
jgi:hypothetical protein